MSKIGRYFEDQIELGNYTVNEYTGVYSVDIGNRKERAAAKEVARDSVQQDGAGRQCADEAEQTQ